MQSLSRRGFLNFAAKKPEPAGSWLHVNRTAMACRFEVTLPGSDRNGIAVANDALDLVDALEAQLSVFRESSEIRAPFRAAGAV